MKTMRAMRPISLFVVMSFTLLTVFAAGVWVGASGYGRLASGAIVANGSNVWIEQADPNTSQPLDAEQTFAPFWQAYNLIQKNYITPPDAETVVDGAIKGMIDALEDEHSGYVEPELFPFLNDLSGEIQGIGVVIRQIEETEFIEVANVLPGTPAEAAGVMRGDIFIEVNGESVVGLTTTELAARVRGPQGTTVDIVFERDEEEVNFTIERALIRIPNVETRMLDGDIAYIKLNEFSANARNDLDEAFTQLNAVNAPGLILDLRDNPGGLLSSAVDIASAFLENGVVLYEQFGDGTEEVFEANGTFLGYRGTLVVLVNENSASASELVTGAWQDAGVATLVGTTTFGKGTVQVQNQLVNGGGLRLTIARWLTPNRNSIHKIGITPDVVVEWTEEQRDSNPEQDPQLEAALEFIFQQNGQSAMAK